jgi:hypothetical protein
MASTYMVRWLLHMTMVLLRMERCEKIKEHFDALP